MPEAVSVHKREFLRKKMAFQSMEEIIQERNARESGRLGSSARGECLSESR